MVGILVGIAVSWCSGVALLAIGRPWGQEPRRASHALISLGLAISLGTAITSGTTFLLLRFSVFARLGPPALAAVDMAVVVALGLFGLLARRRGAAATPTSVPPAHEVRSKRTFAVALGLLFAVALTSHVAMTIRHPHGEWDASMIWNARARFLLRAESGREPRAFDPAVFHADYPLLIPASVARLWKYAGEETVAAPASVDGAFLIATLALLTGGLLHARSRWAAGLGALTLIGSREFIEQAATQNADVAVSCFGLGAMVLLLTVDGAHRPRAMLMLAGLTAACAAWVKDEGLVLLVVIGLSRATTLLVSGQSRRLASDLGFLAVGAIPALAILLAFKRWSAQPNDVVAALTLTGSLERLTDVSRYLDIARTFLGRIVTIAGFMLATLAIYASALGWNRAALRSNGVRTLLVTLGLMLVADFAIYLLTPLDLHWHLRTSSVRLLLQMYPTAILGFFLATRAPGDVHVVSRFGATG